MRKAWSSAFAAGFISAAVFIVSAMLALGPLFLFLAVLPLFYTGLGAGARQAGIAGLIACAFIALIGSFLISANFALLFALPAWYFTKLALTHRGPAGGETEWLPIGHIVLQLTLFACVMIALVTAYYRNEGGIEHMIASSMQRELGHLGEDYGEMVQTVVSQWSFLIFSITVWLWALALYAHAWLANRILLQQRKALRPSMAVSRFEMPNWVLGLMGIAALASLIGSPGMQFLGKSTLISLLLPYCLLGAALMHEASQNWPSRRFFLFFVYFAIFAQLWPALVLSGVGLFHHIKRLPGSPGSSTS